jgi:hypothetical protein
MDPYAVPEELRGFLPMMQVWGTAGDDAELCNLAEWADGESYDRLSDGMSLWTEQREQLYQEWLKRTTIEACPELARFYRAMQLIDELGMYVPGRPRGDWADWEIACLSKHGSEHRENMRTLAARNLMLCDHAAERVVPELRKALDDPHLPVRICAHASLAVLTGERAHHRAAIKRIRRQCNPAERPDVQRWAKEMLAAIDEPARVAPYVLEDALASDHLEAVRRIIKYLDVNDPGRDELPLAVARSLPMVEFLLEQGADPNVPNQFGRTPLHLVILYERSDDIIRTLVQHGADLHARDEDDRTPLAEAQERGCQHLVRMLRELGATA